MKVINVPTLVLTVEEHEKIAEIVSMLYDTDAETDDWLGHIMKDMQGCSLLGILEEILDRAKVSL